MHTLWFDWILHVVLWWNLRMKTFKDVLLSSSVTLCFRFGHTLNAEIVKLDMNLRVTVKEIRDNHVLRYIISWLILILMSSLYIGMYSISKFNKFAKTNYNSLWYEEEYASIKQRVRIEWTLMGLYLSCFLGESKSALHINLVLLSHACNFSQLV